MEQLWNDSDREKSEKNLSQCHFVHCKSHMDLPGHLPWASMVRSWQVTAMALLHIALARVFHFPK
jgi:hypothetical protein